MANHPWFWDSPFLTSSAFSTMAFLSRWARGQGGEWRDYVERFIERKARQGIKAIRVFDETTYWHDRDDNPNNDHKFFNEDRATALAIWDYNQLAQQSRPHRLTPHHQVILLELIRLARKHGMKVELCVDATLKHSPGVGWLVIGHCIKKTARFVGHVSEGVWVPDGEDAMGNPKDQSSNDAIRAAFEAVKGPLEELIAIETHNEADAHSQGSWRSTPEYKVVKDNPEALKKKAFDEVNQQLDRMRRDDHWPGAATWVSEGGDDGQGTELFAYDIKRPDAIAFHPSRPSMEIGDRFNAIRAAGKKHGKPIYANEIIHYIDPSFWWMVDQGIFRPGSSTQNANARMKFVLDMNAMGFWVCDHSLVGMANGMFKNGSTWEEMPLDQFELALLGDDAVDPPPPPPPPPTRKYRYGGVIDMAYLDILGRKADPDGLAYYNGEMGLGMTESILRESLIRSEEFRKKNPA